MMKINAVLDRGVLKGVPLEFESIGPVDVIVEVLDFSVTPEKKQINTRQLNLSKEDDLIQRLWSHLGNFCYKADADPQKDKQLYYEHLAEKYQ
ncbi:MAG: hypothetical protein U9N77_05675 [Thermodesulfobacteriota bacterium]|nr:hypothetical protein [Thermodesulfobacteriota bacterium]